MRAVPPVPGLRREVVTLRSALEDRLRAAIRTGEFRPGQRLIERELCEMTGVSRTSVREALRQLEAEGLVTTIPHRGPIVSTISVEEAEQLYDVRALLEGFAGREFARRRNPAALERLREATKRFEVAAASDDHSALIDAKTACYEALLEGCGNAFIDRALVPLHNRITLLRLTSMRQSGRIARSLVEVHEILRAIEAGDPVAAEAACVAHIRNAAVIALDVLRSETRAG